MVQIRLLIESRILNSMPGQQWPGIFVVCTNFTKLHSKTSGYLTSGHKKYGGIK
jgi:hypothetical protein